MKLSLSSLSRPGRRPVLFAMALPLLSLFSLLPAAAHADDRPITLVVPYPAGGGTDTAARGLGRLLQPVLGQPIVVENLTGAGSRIATQNVIKSPPDGLRLLMTSSDLTINQALRKQPPWNLEKDFTHLAIFATAPLVYVVNAKLPVKNMSEFVEYARQRAKDGNPVNYGSGGIGSLLQLPTLQLAAKYKLDLVHIAYRGAVPMVQDLAAGIIDFGVINPVNVVGWEGKIRALAITGANRHPLIPDTPTMAEAGMPDVASTMFAEIVGPANMPPAVVERLVTALKQVAETDEFKKSMIASGTEPGWLSGPALLPFVQADLKNWQTLGQATGIEIKD